MKFVHKILFLIVILIVTLNFTYSQMNNSTSLTDIYMGNYGFWDYESTGSMQTVEQDSVNFLNFSSVYLTADSSTITPNKRVLYFYSANGGNTWANSIVSNIEATYPSLALQTDGRAVVCFFDSVNTRIRLFRNGSRGSSVFDSLPSPPAISGNNPKILIFRKYLILSVISGGQVQKNRFNLTTNTWESWQSIATGINSASYQIVKGYAGKIAVSWIGDSPVNNVKYIESLDTGATFGSSNTIFTSVIAGIDTLRAFSHIDMVYYSNQPAITWDANAGILPFLGQAGIRKFYVNPRIYFWNQQFGLQVVADSNNYGGFNLPGRNFITSMGYNYQTLGAPSIGTSTSFSTTYIYISYSAAKTNVPFGNSWFDSDIFTKFSFNGNGWSTLFSGVPSDNINDDRYPSQIKYNYPYTGGYSFGLTVQKDKYPGSFRMGDTNSITRAYPEFYWISMFVHTAEENHNPYEFDLCPAYPNPFNAQTYIEYYLPKVTKIKIDIIDILGRNLETLVDGYANRGSSRTIFDGTNFASGTYFCRMFIDGEYLQSQKLVLIK